MPVNVSKLNTKIFKHSNGWISIVHDTGAKDNEGKSVSINATITQASIEVSEGVLLPKAQVKDVIEAALNKTIASTDLELSAL